MDTAQKIHVPHTKEVLEYLEKYSKDSKPAIEGKLKAISSNMEMLKKLTFTSGTSPDELIDYKKEIYTGINEVVNSIKNSYLVSGAMPKGDLWMVHKHLDEIKTFGNGFKVF